MRFLPNLKEVWLGAPHINDLSALRELEDFPRIFYECDGGEVSHPTLLPELQDAWLNLMTEPVDFNKAEEAIRLMNRYLTYPSKPKGEPEIRFFPSPYAALAWLQTPKVRQQRGQQSCWFEQIEAQMRDGWQAWRENIDWFYKRVTFDLGDAITWRILHQLDEDIKFKYGEHAQYNSISPEMIINLINRVEFIRNRSSRILTPESELLLYSLYELFTHCGWIFTFESVFVVCNRPTHFPIEPMMWSEQQSYHKVKIQFADGWGIDADVWA